MPPKSKPAADTAPKPEANFAGQVAKLLNLDNGASEAAILAAVEGLTKATETRIAELADRETKLDEAGTAVKAREDKIADQEVSFAQDVKRRSEALDKRTEKLDARAKALDTKESDLKARADEISSWESEGGTPDLNGESYVKAREATGGGPLAAGKTRVTIIGPKTGRYRIGRQFGPEPVTLDVTADELKALKADPKLSVSEVTK